VSRVAILLVAALILGAQCFAACALFPCTRDAASSSCHHKQSSAPCGHQLYVSEGGRQVLTLISVDGNFLAIEPAETGMASNTPLRRESFDHLSSADAAGPPASPVLRI